MDALYIINAKNKDVLLFKEYKNVSENHLKLQLFLSDMNLIFKNEKSPFVLINGSVFVHLLSSELEDESLIYLAVISNDVIFIKKLTNFNFF